MLRTSYMLRIVSNRKLIDCRRWVLQCTYAMHRHCHARGTHGPVCLGPDGSRPCHGKTASPRQVPEHRVLLPSRYRSGTYSVRPRVLGKVPNPQDRHGGETVLCSGPVPRPCTDARSWAPQGTCRTYSVQRYTLYLPYPSGLPLPVRQSSSSPFPFLPHPPPPPPFCCSPLSFTRPSSRSFLGHRHFRPSLTSLPANPQQRPNRRRRCRHNIPC